MADDDEIDILGDFSFNSCFAQNNQGIPSCSSREDTVHPQWLLDSTEVNWYDTEKDKNTRYNGPSRKLIGDKTAKDEDDDYDTSWSPSERKLLVKEMAKYGRNVKKISQVIKSKTEAEIQALIDAEYGVNLETSSYGIDKCDDQDTPTPVQEEIVTESTIKKVIIQPPINLHKHPFRKKNKQKGINKKLEINETELFYDEDMTIGSTELIDSEWNITNSPVNNISKYQKIKEKKVGNHRRKVSRNFDKGKARNRSRDLLKSPQGRQRKDSSLSDDSVKSPKLQIVLGSGQALPVSEGEQVIKIEKKKDSEPESDIDIDIDSDNEGNIKRDETKVNNQVKLVEEPIAVPLRKFEPMPRRQKRIKVDGGGAGGYTIMHTEAGDLYEVGTEPKRERQPKKQTIHLIRCRFYNAEKPAPFSIRLNVSALILMDAHAHTSRAEVMGLAGGARAPADVVHVSAYCPALAASGATHCDMDPVSAAASSERLLSLGTACVGWHHSHPSFPAAPSLQDLSTQRALQQADCRQLLAIVTSQHWTQGRTATHYRCFRVEVDSSTPDPIGYQLSVNLIPDITPDTLSSFLEELRATVVDVAQDEYTVDMARDVCPIAKITYLDKELRATVVDVAQDEYTVDMARDVCPIAKITYLDKCISSISHHLRSAGYSDDDLVVVKLIHSLRDVFR